MECLRATSYPHNCSSSPRWWHACHHSSNIFSPLIFSFCRWGSFFTTVKKLPHLHVLHSLRIIALHETGCFLIYQFIISNSIVGAPNGASSNIILTSPIKMFGNLFSIPPIFLWGCWFFFLHNCWAIFPCSFEKSCQDTLFQLSPKLCSIV